MKYIKFEHIGIVVFQDGISHKKMANNIQDIPISAGFIRSYDGKSLTTYGDSYTLKLQSDSNDGISLSFLLQLK
jgi:hypothetical protein